MKTVEVDGRAVTMVPVEGVMREAIVEGDKVYVTKGNDLVEFFPKSAPVLARGEVVNFVEGEDYESGLGVFRVWYIRNDGKLVVDCVKAYREVVVGCRYEWPVKAQAEAVVRAKADYEAELKSVKAQVFSGNKDLFTLGYIAAHGNIQATVAPSYFKKFPDLYMGWTGEDVAKHLGHGYLEHDNDNRWSYTLTVFLPVSARSVVEYLDAPVNVRDEKLEINCNKRVRGLFLAGLRIGRNEGNIESIRAMLAVDEQKAFDEGVAA
jgi:hypothetical protein